ncbi:MULTISPECIES: RcnB family protein [unclassified Sphingobium]|uniref:RcnB family protein n=1 Tax=unclassified Sphingobium TaxID=2611147 RepID=UPI002223FBC3|nr:MULTISPECIES: RcnB family protein [unclassified Sphingobium]MCW2393933.1 hypothetical protein [Sphingobium sp. B8D3B]MCW2417447.1 hypothetical protein [Sphingobium sp. B8D3C]
MSRLLTFGLLASTMLVTAPVAAQERSANRGDWIRNQNQQQQSAPRQDGGDRRRDWSGQRGGPSRGEGIRPQPAPQQRPPATVTTTRVAPSDAPRPNWQDRRAPDQAGRPDRPEQRERPRDQPRSWNDTSRNNANWRDDNRQQAENRAEWERRREQANRDGNRTDWRDRDDARRWDGRRDNDWRRNDSTSRDRADWERQRLNERQRWADQRRWDNRWRNDRRYDWQRYRTQYRSVYRMPTYYAPYGWNYGYRRFSIGIYLNDMLFGRNYWISDPYEYRLPPVYGSLRWVRYYDDALLVDTRDGYVVDVIHDFFW